MIVLPAADLVLPILSGDSIIMSYISIDCIAFVLLVSHFGIPIHVSARNPCQCLLLGISIPNQYEYRQHETQLAHIFTLCFVQ